MLNIYSSLCYKCTNPSSPLNDYFSVDFVATPCTDTLSVESCRDALNKDPSSCSDVFIRKMCAFSCQLCSRCFSVLFS